MPRGDGALPDAAGTLRSFLAEAEGRDDGAGLPRFVVDEIDAFLRGGLLAHGFLRVFCPECGESRLVGFACKRRGFCGSCLARRMSDFAAHLVDRVVPRVPVRQWVLTVPPRLRFAMAFDPDLTTSVLRTFIRSVSAWLRKRARRLGARGRLDASAVTVIQRFGSDLRLNVHLHSIVVDGVFQRRPGGPPVFVRVPLPSDADVAEIVARVRRKVTAMLEKRYAFDSPPDATAEPLLATLANAGVAGCRRSTYRRPSLQRTLRTTGNTLPANG